VNPLFLLTETLPTKGIVCKPEDQLDAKEIILSMAVSAISDFIGKKFSDPLIGDQLCEIRAYQLILLSKMDLDEELQSTLANCASAISAIAEVRCILRSLQQEELGFIAEKKKSLEPFKQKNAELSKQLAEQRKTAENVKELMKKFQAEFASIKEESKVIDQKIDEIKQAYLSKRYAIMTGSQIDFPVSQRVLLIVQSYLLTKIKLEKLVTFPSGKVIISDKTLVSNLVIDGVRCPTVLFEAVIPNLKKAVLESSIAFVQQYAAVTLRWNAVKQQNEMPFYFALKIIYQQALADKIPIVLKIRDQTVSPHDPKSFVCRRLFNVDGTNYVPVDGDFVDAPALIVEAYSSQNESVLKTAAFLDQLLASAGGLFNYLVEVDAVQHTQYTDQLETDENIFDPIPDISEEEKNNLVKQRQVALELGFGATFPIQCCVEHVFADLISKQLWSDK
jgi:hypothetical protein